MGPTVKFDSGKQLFVGDHAESINKYLKREYRKGFVVPDLG
jgi:hypothetical protein